jgi:tRNA splicing endonuclease
MTLSKIPLVSLGRKGRLSDIASNPLVIKLVTRYFVFPELPERGGVVEAGFDFGLVFTIWTTSEADGRAELGSISLGLTNRMKIRICIC